MTFDDNEAKKFVRHMIRQIERLLHENIALVSILKGIEIPGFQEQWPRLLTELLAHPEANRELHAKFLSLYDRADQVMDAATALEVLRLVPDPKKKAQ